MVIIKGIKDHLVKSPKINNEAQKTSAKTAIINDAIGPNPKGSANCISPPPKSFNHFPSPCPNNIPNPTETLNNNKPMLFNLSLFVNLFNVIFFTTKKGRLSENIKRNLLNDIFKPLNDF